MNLKMLGNIASVAILMSAVAKLFTVSLALFGVGSSTSAVVAAGAQVLMILGTTTAAGIAWLVWQYQLFKQCHMRGFGTDVTAGWSVAYWFICFLSLYKPYTSLAALEHRLTGTFNRSRLLAGWWFMYLAYGIFGGAQVEDPVVAAISCLLTFLAATSAVMVIRHMNEAFERAGLDDTGVTAF